MRPIVYMALLLLLAASCSKKSTEQEKYCWQCNYDTTGYLDNSYVDHNQGSVKQCGFTESGITDYQKTNTYRDTFYQNGHVGVLVVKTNCTKL